MPISTEYKSDDYLYVNSCGIQHLNKKDYNTVREHGRIDYHIIYIVRGKCYTENLGKETILNEGDMILFYPYEKQTYSFYKVDNSISAYIHFTGTACEKISNDLGFLENRVLRLGKSSEIVKILEKMTEEYGMKRPYYKDMLSAYLIELFSQIKREKELEKNTVYRSNKSKIEYVCKKMFEEYKNSYPVSHYAKYANLSTSRFYYVFRESTGYSPVEYLNKIRINQAKELLKNTDISISEVAEEVGFFDQNYFARVFKKQTGTSPKKYF